VSGQQTRIGKLFRSVSSRVHSSGLARRNMRSPLVKEMVASLAAASSSSESIARLLQGLIQRLDAFDHFLANHREWIDRVIYLQITPKNRSEIPEYAELEEALGSAADASNGKYGEVSWTPIRYVNRVYGRAALAASIARRASAW